MTRIQSALAVSLSPLAKAVSASLSIPLPLQDEQVGTRCPLGS